MRGRSTETGVTDGGDRDRPRFASPPGQRSQVGWAITDQAVSSASNYLVLLLIIRVGTLSEVGAYGFAYTAYFLLMSLGRACTLEPLTVRLGNSDPRWRVEVSTALGLQLGVAVMLGLSTFVLSQLLDGSLSEALLMLALGLCGLLLQDATRLVYFAEMRASAACANDALLLVVQASLYAWSAATVGLSPATLVLGWAGAALVAGCAALVHLRCMPALVGWALFLRSHRNLIAAYVADYLANRGTEQLTLVGILAAGGVAPLGAVTVARTLFAPLTTVQTGLNSVVLPRAARLHRENASVSVQRIIYWLAGFMAGLMLAGGLVLALVPARSGQWALGVNWTTADQLLLPMTVFSVLNAVGFAFWIGAKARQSTGRIFVARLAAGLVMAAAATFGVTLGGATGAVLGMTIGAAALVAGSFWAFRDRQGAFVANRHSFCDNGR